MKEKQIIKDLTWEYFWEQKWKETKWLWMSILVIIAIVTIPPAVGMTYYKIDQELFCSDAMSNFVGYEKCELSYSIIFGMGLIMIIVFGFWILVMWIILESLIKWIKSNWKEAKERAKKEVRKPKLKRGKKK